MALRYVAGLLLAAGCAAPPPKAPAPPPVVDTTAIEPTETETSLDGDDLLVGVLGRDPTALPIPVGRFAQLPGSGDIVYTEKGGLVFGPLDGPVRKVSLGTDVDHRYLYGTPAADRAVVTGAEGALELWTLDGRRLQTWEFPGMEHADGGSHDVAVAAGAFAVARRDGVSVYDPDGQLLYRHDLPDRKYRVDMWLRDGGDTLWLGGFRDGLRRWDRGDAEPVVVLEGSEDRYLQAATVSPDGTRWAYARKAETERSWEQKVEIVLEGREGVVGRWEKDGYSGPEELYIVGDTVLASGRTGLLAHHVGDEVPRRLPGITLAEEPRPPGPLVVGLTHGLTTCDAEGTCRDEPGHRGAVRTIEVVADGRRLVTAGADGRVLHWALTPTGATPTTVFGSDQAVAPRLAVNAQGLAVYGSQGVRDDDEAKLGLTFFPWTEDGLGPARWTTQHGHMRSIAIDPGGWIVAVDRVGDVTLFDLATGKLGVELPLGSARTGINRRPDQRVIVSPDGHGWWGSSQRLRWQLEGGVTQLATVAAPEGPCRWAPGGDLVCAARKRDQDGWPLVVTTHPPKGAARTWQHEVAEDFVDVTSLAVGETVRVVALGFFEDSPTLVFVRGGEVTELELPHPKVTAMALLAGERRLVTGHGDGSLRLWLVPGLL